jgi:hypothetical protein
VILVASDEEERETAALKTSSKWTEGDNLFVIRLLAAGLYNEEQTTSNETSSPSFVP